MCVPRGHFGHRALSLISDTGLKVSSAGPHRTQAAAGASAESCPVYNSREWGAAIVKGSNCVEGKHRNGQKGREKLATRGKPHESLDNDLWQRHIRRSFREAGS